MGNINPPYYLAFVHFDYPPPISSPRTAGGGLRRGAEKCRNASILPLYPLRFSDYTTHTMKIRLYTDGGARGNPGPAAVGVLICNDQDEILLEHAEIIGEATNNVAEYQALLKGMKRAKELGATEVASFLDSELVVKQLKGEYKLKNYNLQKLFDEVKLREIDFTRGVSYTHLRREEDKMRRADQLVNHALNESARKAKRRC